ncbi:prepilin peptidase [Gluconacetobacter takamatsuzukensis]|uniref:Prepilin leader peptidase/N-methyltransferase n=1 Tax=Gluconacetobacter takamatsuzukensis TaxID=1286190 RepID=A0A7W4PPK5_9PROT|nr:A24 family peptidase [Gluconacetobacter takamatsuzukensis]MBB2205313.1 prepilin peptidase [Gluconacetobacter takamatsuzukensis]
MLFSPALPLILAPFIGSFLGVLAWRLPRAEPVILARSACPCCATGLTARELVPLASYLAQKGRCRTCHAPIDPFHPAMEILALTVAALTVLATARDGATGPLAAATAWRGCLFGWWLLVLAAIDLKSFRLPDILTLPLTAAGLILAATDGWPLFLAHAIAALLAYAAFTGLALSYRRLRGHDGLGLGDAKLLAAGGAWLGPAALPMAVCAAALLTLGATLVITRGRIDRATPIPFGPGLAAALWGTWLWQTAYQLHG